MDGSERNRGDSQEEDEPSLIRDGPLAFISRAVIGAAAGLIGVGGGEFRIPVLLHVLRLPVKIAAGANMVVGLFVVVLGLARRWRQHEWTGDDVALAVVMALASVLAAAIGARQASRFSSPFLKMVVCLYLITAGVWMLVEALAHAESVLVAPPLGSVWPPAESPCLRPGATGPSALPRGRV